MTTKNDIIETIVNQLLSQRQDLINNLRNVNHNESSFLEQRMTFQNEIIQIDMQLDRRVMEIEVKA